MGIAAHIARLRAVVGHELLLLPSVSVLPVDETGRILLVREAGHDGWGTLGGAVEPGESPAAAAVREAREEISADIQLIRLLDVLGGPEPGSPCPCCAQPAGYDNLRSVRARSFLRMPVPRVPGMMLG